MQKKHGARSFFRAVIPVYPFHSLLRRFVHAIAPDGMIQFLAAGSRMRTDSSLRQDHIKNACADEMNFRQIALAEFAGAALRQEFCGRGMAEMQPSARVGFLRCCLNLNYTIL
jgi:hypothetical protein